MKRFLLFTTMLMISFAVFAQRIAVMEFENTSGISLGESNTISATFATYCQPAGYTVVERQLLDKILEEQKIQASDITEDQRVKLKDLYNITIIVTGHISYFGGYYTVDVRAICVETGVRLATDGVDFTAPNMREQMKKLAQNLADKISVSQDYSVNSSINTSITTDYVDLGLPSGTLWRVKNEKGMYYSWIEAKSQFGDKLPTKEQFAELKAFCTWEWIGKGYKVTGDNGNSIVLPAAGYKSCYDSIDNINSQGRYWTSDSLDEFPYWFYFASRFKKIGYTEGCYGSSVRLIKNP